MMRQLRKVRDIIDSTVVEAIDRLGCVAPGVSNWWEDLVLPASALRQEYNERVPYPALWRSVRPYAYLPFFAPRYLPRLRHALRAAGLNPSALLKLKDGMVRILDLGAGTGILTVACLLELERACRTIDMNIQVQTVLRDSDQDSLDVASHAIEFLQDARAWPHLEVNWRCQQSDLLSELDSGLFDVVLLGHVICESYQFLHAKQAQNDDFLGPLLRPLFSTVKRQLSDYGVVVIVEPLNENHLSTPLWIRNYVRANSELTILAPCLGTSLHCPELIAPYSRTPACSGSTYGITWDSSTRAGHRLRLFTEATLQVRGTTLSLPISPSCFFPLVLSRAGRNPVPQGVGMAVRRLGPNNKTWDTQPVCLPGADGQEQVQAFLRPGSNAKRSVFRAVDVRDSNRSNFDDLRNATLMDFDLSALYPKGWPVVL